MEEDIGLAEQQDRAMRSNQLVDEVIKLLQQGMSPQELMQMGIPQEVIEAAMQTVRGRMQMPQEGQGLAQMMGA